MHAASSGTVIQIATGIGNTYNKPFDKRVAYGNHVRVQHADGTVAIYAHFKDVRVKKGDSVTVLTIIGTTDNSGWSSAPHFHFEVRDSSGHRLDPYGERQNKTSCNGAFALQCGTDPLWATCPPTPYNPESPPKEVDGDGDGYLVSQGDCDDKDDAIHPDATESCDDKDNDCNGTIDDPFQKGTMQPPVEALGTPCSIGTGKCKNTGVRVCNRFDATHTACPVDPLPPDCVGKQCGPDGCGGTCGECFTDQVCNAQYQCAQCPSSMDCDSRECGPDPVCGESCGDCTPPTACDTNGSCICIPDCTDKLCGEDDGCGGGCESADADGDGYGNPTEVLLSCDPVENSVANNDDCDDESETTFPDAT
ncbi:MAG: peptidoglycan DD-metalloendopeptidase family protein, partial [Patescibacteria group bacterium]